MGLHQKRSGGGGAGRGGCTQLWEGGGVRRVGGSHAESPRPAERSNRGEA